MPEVVNTYQKMKEAEEAREDIQKVFEEHPKVKQIFDLLDEVRKSSTADLFIYSIFFTDETMSHFSDIFSQDEELVDIAKCNLAHALTYNILDDGSFRMLNIVNDFSSLTYMRAVLDEDWWDAVKRFIGENDLWKGFPSKIIRIENIHITFDMIIKMLQMTMDMVKSGTWDSHALLNAWTAMFYPEGLLKSKKPRVVTYDIDDTDLKIYLFPCYGEEYD